MTKKQQPAKITITPEPVKEGKVGEMGQNQPPASRAHIREEDDSQEVAGYDQFPAESLDGTERTAEEALRKVFTPEMISRHYWRLLHAAAPFKRKDGSMGVTVELATQLRALIALDDRISGKPALALPAAIKAETPADDFASLVEAAKTSPMMKERLAARLREQLAELEKPKE